MNMKIKHARLIAPLSTLAVGTTIAVAVRIGHRWSDAIATEVVVVLFAVGYYLLTGTKSDIGAIYGQREDERQRHVVMKASRFAMIVMFGVTFVIALIMVAANKTYWQEDVIASVGGVSYFLALLAYGAHDEDATDDDRGIMATDSVTGVEQKNNVRPPM